MTGPRPIVAGEIMTTKEFLMKIALVLHFPENIQDTASDTPISKYDIAVKYDATIERWRWYLDFTTAELERFKARTTEEWLEDARSHLGYALGEYRGSDEEKILRKMLRKVQAWNPPEGQQDIKEYAISQLEAEIAPLAKAHEQPTWQNAISYRESVLKSTQRLVDHFSKELAAAEVKGAAFHQFVASLDDLDD